MHLFWHIQKAGVLMTLLLCKHTLCNILPSQTLHKGNFLMKNVIFVISVDSIYSGYTLEPPHDDMRLGTRIPVFGVSDHIRFKLAGSAAETC